MNARLILQFAMSCILFLLGALSIGAGLLLILRREYQETLRVLAQETQRLSSPSSGRLAPKSGEIVAGIEASTQLLQTVQQLLQTATGISAFLILVGLVLCGSGFWISQQGCR